LEDIIKELRSRLEKAAERNTARGILLSGGLDTSILALLSPGAIGLNIRLNGYGEDLKYAEMLAGKLGLELHPKSISIDEALAMVPEVIKILGSFDPALPNDLAVYLGLRLAREKGLKSVTTGDGADELFAGYGYMLDLDLKEYLPRLAERMCFSSSRLGAHLGVEVKQPFLDRDIIDLALSISPELKIREHHGVRHGKWILRETFAPWLPEEIVWQTKRPIEVGSGFSRLHEIIGAGISDEELAEAEATLSLKFLSRDHLFYYRTYRRVVGEIPPPQPGEAGCPGCGTGIAPQSRHCRVCGWSRGI